MKTIVVSVLHDPVGIFPKLIKNVQSELIPISKQGLIVACSSSTLHKTKNLLNEIGATLETGESWGMGRINGLKKASKVDFEYVVVIDFDKLLHWLVFDKEEIMNFLNKAEASDFMVGGRTKACWQTYPASWKKAEISVNKAYSKKVGLEVDPIVALTKLNRKAVKVVNTQARETGWASNCEWLLIAWKNGLKIDSRTFDGLTWEDVDRLDLSPAEINRKYNSSEEWEKRRKIAREQRKILSAFAK